MLRFVVWWCISWTSIVFKGMKLPTLPEDVQYLIQQYIDVEDQINMLGFSKTMTLETMKIVWENIFIYEFADPRISLIENNSGIFPYNKFVANIGYTVSNNEDPCHLSFMQNCPNLTHLGLHIMHRLSAEWIPHLFEYAKNIEFLAFIGNRTDFQSLTTWESVQVMYLDQVPDSFENIKYFINLRTLVIKQIDDTVLVDEIFPSVTELSFKQAPSRSPFFIQKVATMFPNVVKFEFAGVIQHNESDESCIDLTCFKKLKTIKLMGQFIANDSLEMVNMLSFEYKHPLQKKIYHNIVNLQINWVIVVQDGLHNALLDVMREFSKFEFQYEINFMNGFSIRGPVPEDTAEIYKAEEYVFVKCVPRNFVLILNNQIIVFDKGNFIVEMAEFLCLIGVDERVTALSLVMMERFLMEAEE